MFARFQGRLKSFRIGNRTQAEHQIQILARPIACQGRDIVRTDHRNRLFGIFFGQFKAVPAFAEIHDLIRKHLITVQQIPRLVWYCPQILANDHASIPPAFQSQDGKHHICVVMHIRAKVRRLARNPPQTAQSHHMIDAQDAVKPHIFTQKADELLIARVLQHHRIERRQIPVLPRRAEWIGRRTDRHIHAVIGAVKPSVRAAACYADRQIAVNPQLHAARRSRLVHFAQLLRAKPLQPHIKTDFAAMTLCKSLNCLTMRIMKLRRPRQPTHFTGAVVILIQRLKQTEAFQSPAAFFDKGVKCRPLLFGGFASVVFKRVKRPLQSIALERPNRRISDGFRNPQRRNALADIRLLEPVFQLFVVSKRADLFHIQINRIEPFARRRAVRAGKSRLGAEKRMQRIDADEIQLLIRRKRHQIQQIGKIPDAPVPLRTQAVQMRGQPVHAQTVFQHFRLINRLRRNHQPYLADAAFHFRR